MRTLLGLVVFFKHRLQVMSLDPQCQLLSAVVHLGLKQHFSLDKRNTHSLTVSSAVPRSPEKKDGVYAFKKKKEDFIHRLGLNGNH